MAAFAVVVADFDGIGAVLVDDDDGVKPAAPGVKIPRQSNDCDKKSSPNRASKVQATHTTS